MIQEAYCSYEVAKLLKEKGFDCCTYQVYDPNGEIRRNQWKATNETLSSHEYLYNRIVAPTHQMAIAWLREKGIDANIFLSYISIEFGKKEKHYSFEIISDNTDYNEDSDYATYEEAVEAALKYVLENLI